MRRNLFGALALAAFALALPASAGPSRPYQLDETSSYVVGCFAPCLCPVLMQSPLLGRFTLSPLDTDASELRFDVAEIEWIADHGENDVRVTGSGTYRIVSDGDTRHQMTLSLSVDGGPEQIFDSGLVPGGDKFPYVDIAVASGNFFCWDSVFTIRARAEVASTPTAGGAIFSRAWPNPFRAATSLRITLPNEDVLTIRVHDVSGRTVRTLADRQPYAEGIRDVVWDGKDDGGRDVPAGLYWVRLAGWWTQSLRSLVKIDD